MKTKFMQYVQSHHRVALSALLGAVVGGLCVAQFQFIAYVQTVFDSYNNQAPSVIESVYVLPQSEPTSIRIPSANIEAPFEGALGLNEDQEVEVPESYEAVGWYEYGPTPGEQGPSVVLGHVDSYEGPAIFYNLKEVTEGDVIFVDRADGSTAQFVVHEVERVSQRTFPRERVYGDTKHAELRLITCTGTFSKGKQRYSHNLIVYARLVEGEG